MLPFQHHSRAFVRSAVALAVCLALAGQAKQGELSLISVASANTALSASQLPVLSSVFSGASVAATTSANGSVGLTITQSQSEAILNWDSFSIGSAASVTFVQPDKSSIALNRVIGADMSVIAGQLSGNGQVWLLNPNGVVANSGAQISAQGVLFTTRELSDSKFTATGPYAFSSGAVSGAPVRNMGSIIAGNFGYAVLAGEKVSNEGKILAQLGDVVLGGSRTFTVDVVGDRLLSFAITGAVENRSSALEALVSNAGQIRADGGRIVLSASAAGAVLDNVINLSGLVQANSVQLVDNTVSLGRVTVDAGDNGELLTKDQLIGTTVQPAVVSGDRVELRGDRVFIGNTIVQSQVVIPTSTSVQAQTSSPSQAGIFIAAQTDILMSNANLLSHGSPIVLLSDVNADTQGGVDIANSSLQSKGGLISLGGGNVQGGPAYAGGLTRSVVVGLEPDSSVRLSGSTLLDSGSGNIEIRGLSGAGFSDAQFTDGLIGTPYAGYYEDNFMFFANAPVLTSQLTRFAMPFTQINGVTPGRDYSDFYSNQFVGYFYAPVSGIYDFRTTSDDASHLFIGQAGATISALRSAVVSGTSITPIPVVNNGGLHGAVSKTGSVTLAAGQYYPLVLLFGENGGGDVIFLDFKAPDKVDFTNNGAGFYFNGNPVLSNIATGISLLGNGVAPLQLKTGSGQISISGSSPSTDPTMGLKAQGNVIVSSQAAAAVSSLTGDFSAMGRAALVLSAQSGASLSASVGVSQNNALQVVGPLALTGNATTVFSLTNTGNAFSGPVTVDGSGRISLSGSGELDIRSAGALNLGAIQSAANIRVSNQTGDLTLFAPVSSVAGDITLVSGGRFINSAGSTAFQVASDKRFLVYTNSPDGNAEGGLQYAFRQYNATEQSLVLGGGNGFLYRQSPIATLQSAVRFDKIYDGTVAFFLDPENPITFSGLVNGDVVSGVGTLVYDTKHAGDRKLQFSDQSPSIVVSNAGRFVFGYQVNTSGLSGRILQKNLTVSTIVAQSKVYDGSTLASVVVAGADYEGLVENDKVLISSTGVFDSKNVGSGKAVSLSNTFSGEDVGNYVITAQGTATADITARALMISGIVAADKIFDGNRSAVLNTRASVFSGLLAGDDVCLTAQGQFADEAAGSAKVVTISSVFSGADAGNYLIAPQTTTTATITERIVTTVTAAPVPPPPPPPAAPAPAAPAPVAAPAAVDSAAADAPAASADSAPVGRHRLLWPLNPARLLPLRLRPLRRL